VEATEKLLSAELAASAGLRTESATLASELSSVKSELASTAQQLDAERAESQDIRAQLEAIKSEYITAGRCWMAGLGWAGLGWAGLGWAGLGWAGLGWAGLGWAGLASLRSFLDAQTQACQGWRNCSACWSLQHGWFFPGLASCLDMHCQSLTREVPAAG
jgi:hypothetical protein